MIRDTNPVVSLTPLILLSSKTSAVLIWIQAATQIFILILIAAVFTMWYAITKVRGINAKTVPASEASTSPAFAVLPRGWVLSVLTVPISGRVLVLTVLTLPVLLLLLLSETFLVTAAVENSLPAPGRTACLYVKVGVVTANL